MTTGKLDMRHKLGVPIVAILIALAGPAAGQANRSPAVKPQPDAGAAIVKQAMVFYLAKGQEDACGLGCREWIAAEGQFDPAAAQRFKAFLARLGRRKLPVFFHSAGGIQGQAFEIGRLLRKREMTAGVSMTIPAGCIGGSDQTCKTLKQSGQNSRRGIGKCGQLQFGMCLCTDRSKGATRAAGRATRRPFRKAHPAPFRRSGEIRFEWVAVVTRQGQNRRTRRENSAVCQRDGH